MGQVVSPLDDYFDYLEFYNAYSPGVDELELITAFGDPEPFREKVPGPPKAFVYLFTYE
jgi:hypothetical protein